VSNLLRIIKDRRKLWIKPRESPKNLTPGIEPEEEEVIFGISKKLETTKEAKAKETEEAEKLQEEIEKVSSKLIIFPSFFCISAAKPNNQT